MTDDVRAAAAGGGGGGGGRDGARICDSCHVTSVKRGDLEGVGGRQQKLVAFYCIFELFRPLLAASLGKSYERCR